MASNSFITPSEALQSTETSVAKRTSPLSQTPLTPDDQLEMLIPDPPGRDIRPMTLCIHPNSFLIEATQNGGSALPSNRALYQLTRPLDGHRSSVTIATIPPEAHLRADGRCETVTDGQLLYKIYQETEGSQKATAKSSRSKKLIHVALVMRGLGFGKSWEAWNHVQGQDSKSSRLYHVKPNGTSTEWKDTKGNVVAVERSGPNRTADAQELEILIWLDKRMMNKLVSVWVAKIWLDARIEWLKEEEQEKKKRRAERRRLTEQEAGDSTEEEPHNAKEDDEKIEEKIEAKEKPHGRLRTIKAALGKVGIGHSEKTASK